jgi:hypothetical protein
MFASIKARRERFEPMIRKRMYKLKVFAFGLENSNSKRQRYRNTGQPYILLERWIYFPRTNFLRK